MAEQAAGLSDATADVPRKTCGRAGVLIRFIKIPALSQPYAGMIENAYMTSFDLQLSYLMTNIL
jgi:hypothetical protein